MISSSRIKVVVDCRCAVDFELSFPLWLSAGVVNLEVLEMMDSDPVALADVASVRAPSLLVFSLGVPKAMDGTLMPKTMVSRRNAKKRVTEVK